MAGHRQAYSAASDFFPSCAAYATVPVGYGGLIYDITKPRLMQLQRPLALTRSASTTSEVILTMSEPTILLGLAAAMAIGVVIVSTLSPYASASTNVYDC